MNKTFDPHNFSMSQFFKHKETVPTEEKENVRLKTAESNIKKGNYIETEDGTIQGKKKLNVSARNEDFLIPVKTNSKIKKSNKSEIKQEQLKQSEIKPNIEPPKSDLKSKT